MSNAEHSNYFIMVREYMCLYPLAVAGYLLSPTRGCHSQKNIPVTAVPVIVEVCGHRKSSICQKAESKISYLLER